MKTPKLTKAQWVEIYYALDFKRLRVARGDYGSIESKDIITWVTRLDAIIKKIGPDGQRMTNETY